MQEAQLCNVIKIPGPGVKKYVQLAGSSHRICKCQRAEGASVLSLSFSSSSPHVTCFILANRINLFLPCFFLELSVDSGLGNHQ